MKSHNYIEKTTKLWREVFLIHLIEVSSNNFFTCLKSSIFSIYFLLLYYVEHDDKPNETIIYKQLVNK